MKKKKKECHKYSSEFFFSHRNFPDHQVTKVPKRQRRQLKMVDSFFVDPSKRKRKTRANRQTSTVRTNQKRQKSQQTNKASRIATEPEHENDSEEIDSLDEEEVDSDVFADVGEEKKEVEDINESDEEEDNGNESAADKRRRLAKQYLKDLKESLGQGGVDSEDDDLESSGKQTNYAFDAKDLDDEIISSRLKKDVAEQKGWVYKFYSKQIKSIIKRKVTRVANNCLTSVSVHYPYLFTTSKDLEISKWDIRDSTKNPTLIKTVKGGIQHLELSKEHSENGHCDEIYASAVSPDGKYLVTGGKDGRIIVWSVNSLSCIRVLETKNRNGQVLSLTFRRNSDQLYVACADLKIRTYSINQLAQLETLYGHQDLVTDISALAMERCVTVGSRDRTAMLWKIPDETRLTFRGGDSIEKFKKSDTQEKIFFEGSIDCVSMIDDSHFVTGSDNGNISLWSLNKKKPLFTKRVSHGIQPKPKASNASAENDQKIREEQISEPQPFWITSIYAIPFSDVFVSGSWDGRLKIWKLDEQQRSFELLMEIPIGGIVTRISHHEDAENGQLRIYTTVSKEHKFSRCVKPLPGSRNALLTCIIDMKET